MAMVGGRDYGDTQFNNTSDTEIAYIDGYGVIVDLNEDDNITLDNILVEDNLPLISGGNNYNDTYRIDSLPPALYFAQIEDCLVDGCGLIVEFDLRPEPEPIFLDVVIDLRKSSKHYGESFKIELDVFF